MVSWSLLAFIAACLPARSLSACPPTFLPVSLPASPLDCMPATPPLPLPLYCNATLHSMAAAPAPASPPCLQSPATARGDLISWRHWWWPCSC